VSTRLLSIGNKSVINVIALIFSTGVAGYKRDSLGVLRWEGVAVDDGDRHGGAGFGRILYGDPRRLMYCTGVLPGKLSTFRTITVHPNKSPSLTPMPSPIHLESNTTMQTPPIVPKKPGTMKARV